MTEREWVQKEEKEGPESFILGFSGALRNYFLWQESYEDLDFLHYGPGMLWIYNQKVIS